MRSSPQSTRRNRSEDLPICIALDVPTLDEAIKILDALADRVRVFKIGLQLFCAEGPRAVQEVRARGVDVFLDLKVSDIPNTAAGAVRAARELGVSYLTVHGNGGRAMVRASVEAAGDELKILVVSVLTSLDDEALRDIGVQRSAGDLVLAMAQLATEQGAPGLVLSAEEVAAVRASQPGLFLVTPGIRPAATGADDQRRVGTPGAVIAAGADLLVLGRAVTAASEPLAALDAVAAEIEDARTGMHS